MIEPVSVPAASGVNLMLIAQLAGEGPSVVPQVLVCEKSPLAATVIDVDPVPVFFTVTTLAALVVPIVCAANVSLVGVAVTTTVAALPVPVRATVCGEFVALSATETVPVRVPTAVGLNVTDMVQLALLPPSVVPQGVVPLPTAAKFPVVVIASEVLAVPVFFTVTVLPALVVPTVCAANVSVVGVTATMTVPVPPVPVRLTV